MKKLKLLAMLAMILLPAAMSFACPMCKDSIPNSDAEQAGSLPGGFNFSVYYMLIGFFTTLALSIGVITKGIRNTNNRMPKN